MADPADDAFYASAARDDPLAFLPLYDRYATRVERYIQARIGRTCNVEDLVSTTFIQALANIHTFDPGRGTFVVWLFAIARNAVNMHLRKHRAVWRNDTTPCGVDIAPSAEETALRREQLRGLEVALHSLTVDQRDALALRYLADLTFSEVGRTLGKSEAAAKMLVRRAIDALRRQLERQE
jgi:RNA polymerase sigma factor (sigma-70 family)